MYILDKGSGPHPSAPRQGPAGFTDSWVVCVHCLSLTPPPCFHTTAHKAPILWNVPHIRSPLGLCMHPYECSSLLTPSSSQFSSELGQPGLAPRWIHSQPSDVMLCSFSLRPGHILPCVCLVRGKQDGPGPGQGCPVFWLLQHDADFRNARVPQLCNYVLKSKTAHV